MSLQILWFILIGLLLAVYYVLDGFDLGAGILSPFIAKEEEEKEAIIKAVGPVWDGNEVWLLTGGGALFAAFAPAYATAFSGFYLAIMLVLFGLIIRAVALEFRTYDTAWRKLWDILFFIGSLVPALLYGVALGNCLQGVALDMNGDYVGSFFDLLGLFPLAVGILGLSTIILQGACWLCLKIELGTELQRKAANVRSIMQIVTLVLVLAVTVMFFSAGGLNLSEGFSLPVAAIGVIVLIVAVVVGFMSATRGKDLVAFICSSLMCVALFVLFAASIFPDIIVSSGPGPSITIASAAASDYNLTVMTIIACIGVPLVLIYHVLIYRAFRGRVPVGKK